MMRNTGKPIRRLALLLALPLLLLAAATRAEVSASVDRSDVALGDTLVLTLSASADDENLQGVDTSHLSADFEVLSRNLRSSMTLINGQQTHKRELTMEIAPRRAGQLVIPPFAIGSSRTRAIPVSVSDRPQVDPGDEVVLFSAAVDSDEVYVQGQVLLTLSIQQSVNLERAGVSELDLPNAFVVPLEQKSYQRRMHGRLWLVQEVRYAIFPEQSGTLEIPAQQFSARESIAPRSLFNPGSRGRVIRRDTDPIEITVQPKPLDYPASADWLPARSLQVEEEWSQDPANLKVGESVTRTIRIRGEGLQGAQLPPTLFPQQDGLKFYPDQPKIEDREIASGLQGVRQDSVAIVPLEAGTIDLPAIEIPWWDTATNSLRKAVIPAHSLKIAAATGAATPVLPTPTAESGVAADPGAAGQASSSPGLFWPLLALFCALGWALTLFLYWRRRTPPAADSGTPETETEGARSAYRNLVAACTSGAAAPARNALIGWANALSEHGRVTSLGDARLLFADDALDAALAELEASLYSRSAGSWDGSGLKAVAERLRKQGPGGRNAAPTQREFALYPGN
ncbi:BatD family protein [Haliea sp. E17]|uniref:BatD family protein n=1 Tax=Haliea sp. E17 TaxID=3401576 RepID=UPI003AAE3D67